MPPSSHSDCITDAAVLSANPLNGALGCSVLRSVRGGEWNEKAESDRDAIRVGQVVRAGQCGYVQSIPLGDIAQSLAGFDNMYSCGHPAAQLLFARAQCESFPLRSRRTLEWERQECLALYAVVKSWRNRAVTVAPQHRRIPGYVIIALDRKCPSMATAAFYPVDRNRRIREPRGPRL